ncbi:CDP-glycerol glycerophosphotransferase family protein [Knoellia sp. Soil729]|uniref:CDP-glycerol glycerophosphotransferase family protein n=1 Tax=Knoellia sp. Soil729 TaxID=1736394 RepID=UPI0006FC0B04|nr:CDP-glycerol glycerophosphotransferase family protein [Knoellia sp. Soil729]KRE43738.1 hypothetical protein ASG74_02540 [Knoellia sp. Soil729]
MRVPRPLFALLAAGFAVALVGVGFAFDRPGAGGLIFLGGTVMVLVAESLLVREAVLLRALEAAHIGGTVRAGLFGFLVAGLSSSLLEEQSGSPHLAPAVAALAWVLHLIASFLSGDATAARETMSQVSWRQLSVPGVRRTAPLPLAGRRPLERMFLGALALLGAGTALVHLGAPSPVLVGSAVVAALLVVAEVVIAGVERIRALDDTGLQESVERLADALAAYSPDAIFYYSRPEAIGYIANVWMPVLDQLERRIIVLCREQYNADLVATSRLPVVLVRRANDLEKVVPSSARLAMYPSNVAKNNHLIRVPGLVDVFIGHGDSDKGGSATTLSRIYDEVWVSGPAARDRYRTAHAGVRDDQIREIGRPQLAEVVHASPEDDLSGDRVSVLYAPTREGFFSAWQYSSILTQGHGILSTLLADPGVQVLFKPHPGTGTDDPAFGEEVQRLVALVEGAGAPHEVVSGTEGLYQAFNRADVLVSDISSVITDFLASEKPYVVTDPSGISEEDFRREFPSAAGAWILTGDGTGVAEAVRDAVGEDRHADRRRRTAGYLLGSAEGDPLARFDAAFDDAVAATQDKAANRPVP